MKRIISFDWDYFIKATAFQRDVLFPDNGDENISYVTQDFIWDSKYRCSPEIKNIGILKNDYNTANHILSKFVEKYLYSKVANPYQEMLVTISHKWIYDFIMQRTKKGEEFEVYNVDFHHDMYNFRSGDEEVNCGNWVNCLREKRPKMKYFWVKREDSETHVLGGETVDCEFKSLEEIKDLPFDYVFICRSDCWSPPHLDTYFDTMWALVRQYMPVEIKDRAMWCRNVNAFSDIK